MAKRKKRSNFEFYKNNRTYLKWYRKLFKIAVSRYKWENLPESVDPRFLEMTLFERGMAAFFQDPVLGYLALPTTIQGMLNVYNIPTQRMAYANNGYQMILNETNSVVIFNDYTHCTGYEEIEAFAYDLYLCDEVRNINIKAQRTPVLIKAPEAQRLTLENVFMQFDGNKPVIYGTDDLNLDAIEVINLNAPFVADKINVLKADIWNEALTALGIPNVAQNKRSSLLTDEVERMQGGSFSSRYSGLAMREEACEDINKMFGLDISVHYRLDDDISTSPQDAYSDNENVEEIKVDE